MAKVDMDGDSGGDYPRPDPLYKNLKFKHRGRLPMTIADVSEVWETEAFNSDEMVEKLTIFFRADVETIADEFDLSDKQVDALNDEIDDYNERVQEAREEAEDRDLDADYEELPDGVVQLPMIVTANLTRGEQAQHHSNLYKLLKTAGLAVPHDEPRKFHLEDADGNEVNPFEDAETNEEVNASLVEYLRKNLVGTECSSVELKNANRENSKDEYSTVGEVIDA